MSLFPSRGIVLAAGIAVLMHLILFALVMPSPGDGVFSTPVPPNTRYAVISDLTGESSESVRVIRSPVVFSLPSDRGFSMELLNNDVQTRKAFMQQQVRSEQFLDIDPVAYIASSRLDPREIMITAPVRDPALPQRGGSQPAAHSPSRRVSLSRALRQRLIGGIVLPSDLNQPADKPWEAQASLSISDQGAVEHVFLDRPLESSALNQQILQVLYRLRFKPGSAVHGNIQIYSPEPVAATEGVK